MEGGYHGTYDDIEVSVHPDLADPPSVPTARRTPIARRARACPATRSRTSLVTPFNDIDAAERLITERGDEIAAVIVEPVMGSAGMIPADPCFLAALRDADGSSAASCSSSTR